METKSNTFVVTKSHIKLAERLPHDVIMAVKNITHLMGYELGKVILIQGAMEVASNAKIMILASATVDVAHFMFDDEGKRIEEMFIISEPANPNLN